MGIEIMEKVSPRNRRVYIPNKSFHSFEGAKDFGDLIFITEGSVNRFNVNNVFRACLDAMFDARPEDYLLVSSLGILNAAAASIMAMKFGRINFLLFDNYGKYVVREIYFSDMGLPFGPNNKEEKSHVRREEGVS